MNQPEILQQPTALETKKYKFNCTKGCWKEQPVAKAIAKPTHTLT